MKFTCRIKDFLDKLLSASRCTAKQDTKPDLCHVFVEAKNKQLVFSATNTVQYVKTNLAGVDVKEKGEFIAPTPKLVGFLAACETETATFVQENGVLNISSGRSKCTLPTFASNLYPRFAKPANEPDVKVVMKKCELDAAAKKTAPFVGVTKNYFAAAGVKVDVTEQDKVMFVGLDGRVIAVREIAAEHVPSSVGLAVPTEFFGLVGTSFGDDDEITLYLFNNSIAAGSAETFVSSGLIEGRYPSWKGVFADRLSKRENFKIKKELLLAKLRGLASVLDGDQNRLKACEVRQVEDGPLVMISGLNGSGAEFDIPVDLSSGFELFRLDIEQFIAVVRTFSCADIHIEISEGNGAVALYDDASAPKHACVMMMLETLQPS